MEPRRRFRIIKELSEGAFGKVYLSEMITGDNFKSVVAIKLLHGQVGRASKKSYSGLEMRRVYWDCFTIEISFVLRI